MKIEKINYKKIKITLYEEDLLEWNIKMDDVKPDSEELKHIFWSIIHRIQTDSEFYTDGTQLIVEAIKRTDSIVMTVSKTDNKPKESITETTVFYFESLNDVTDGCLAAVNTLEVKSRLYKYKDLYYLVTESQSEHMTKLADILFSEYGTCVKNCYDIANILSEYGELMIKDNALETAAFL